MNKVVKLLSPPLLMWDASRPGVDLSGNNYTPNTYNSAVTTIKNQSCIDVTVEPARRTSLPFTAVGTGKTFETWVYQTANPADYYPWLYGFTEGTYVKGFSLHQASGSWQLVAPGVAFMAGSASTVLNDWQKIVVLWKTQTTFSLYLNGVFQFNTAASVATLISTNSVLWASSGGASNLIYTKNFSIFDGIKTADQIQKEYYIQLYNKRGQICG